MTPDPVQLDRSRFRRVRAPMLVRPVGVFARNFPRSVNEARVGGLRAYSDEEYRIGRRLELEIFLENQSSVSILVEVAWVEALAEEALARFDVGLRYVIARPEDLSRLAPVL